MNKIGLRFGDKQLESKYIQFRAPLTKKLLVSMSVCYLIVQIYMLATTLISKGDLTFALALLVPFSTGLIVLWKCPNYTEAGCAIIAILGFLIGMLFESNRISSRTAETAFFLGYSYASIQRVVQTHLIHYQYVILSGIAMICVRSIIMGPGQIWIYIAHLVIDLYILFASYKYEVMDRNMFYSLKKSEEELLKFKDLLVELPLNIITIDKKMEKILFVNNFFKNEMSKHFVYSNVSDFLDNFILRNEEISILKRSVSVLPDLSATVTLKNKIQNLLSQECKLHHAATLNVSTKSQPRRVYEVKVNSMSWDGIEALSIVFQDNTDQEKLMNLKADHAHKDKVIDSISHELRTPLNGMNGLIQLVEEKITPDEEVTKNIDLLKKNVSLLNSIINSILDLQQIRSNKIKLEASAFNLRILFEELLQQFNYQASAKNLYLRLDIPFDVTEEIYTDKNRLMQIIVSLLGNAIKFTDQGGVTLKVKNDALETNRLEIWIEDTGEGIKQEDQDRLFQMYGKFIENTSSSSNNMKGGVGLGLTIAKCLARELNGKKDSLELKMSLLKVGSVFGFKILKRLDLQEPEVHPSERQMQQQELEESFSEANKSTSVILGPSFTISEGLKRHDSRYVFDEESVLSPININRMNRTNGTILQRSSIGKRLTSDSGKIISGVLEKDKIVLVVDDNPFNLRIVTQFLVNDYAILTADNGEKAVNLVKSKWAEGDRIDLIIMDIQMPVMDGYEATLVLKDLMQKKQLPNIPIIALTANDRAEDKARSKQVGMDMHMSKPFKKEELLSAVKQYI